MSANNIALKTENTLHKKELSNIQKEHEIDIEKIKLQNQKQQQEIKVANKVQLESIKNGFEQKKLEQINQNEKVLNELKNSTNMTKELTQKELQNIKTNHQAIKQNEEQNFENLYSTRKALHEIELQELNHELSMQNRNLHKKSTLEKTDLANANRLDTRLERANGKNEKNQLKSEITKEIDRDKEKYARALMIQTSTHKKQLAHKESKFQELNTAQQERYKKELDEVKQINSQQIEQKKYLYENKYSGAQAEHEKSIQNLEKRKAEIVQNISRQLVSDIKLKVKKSDDDFYRFSKLEPRLKDIGDKYQIEVPAPETEINAISLTGEERQLRISFNRNFEEKIKEKDGSFNSVNRVESYMSKLNVDEIIDPKQIEKEYKDGAVLFTIAKR